jgi:hypothetical protein
MLALLRLVWWMFWWIVRTIIWMIFMALLPFIALFLVIVLVDDEQRLLGWMWRFWSWTRELKRKGKQVAASADTELDASLL